MYMRHCCGAVLEDVSLHTMVQDERHALVLDDCQMVSLSDVKAETTEHKAQLVLVEQMYKRPTGHEHVPAYPYHAMGCSGIRADGLTCEVHTVRTPEPGVQPDVCCELPTVANAASGFAYGAASWRLGDRSFPLPVTVYRPFFDWMPDVQAVVGEAVTLTPRLNVPACGVGEPDLTGISITCEGAPDGCFCADARTLTWMPDAVGDHTVTFIADDGVLPVSRSLCIHVKEKE